MAKSAKRVEITLVASLIAKWLHHLRLASDASREYSSDHRQTRLTQTKIK
jgi:hypothetical protein